MQKLISSFLILILLSGICFSQMTKVKGRLLGYDGKPLIKAVIEFHNMSRGTFLQVEVKKDGSFFLETGEKSFQLKFSGVNHSSLLLPVIIKDAAEINFDVLLATNAYTDDYGKVKLIGNFNNWDIKNTIPLKKNKMGIYYADIETSYDQVEYQLIGLSRENIRQRINGTMSDDYKYRNDREFSSVIYKKGKTAHIEFDPAKLIPENPEAKLITGNENLPEIIMIKDGLAYSNQIRKLFEEGRKKHNIKPILQSIRDGIKDKTKKENDDFLKGYYRLSYLKNSFYLGPDKDDSLIYRQILEVVKPESGLWTIGSDLPLLTKISSVFINDSTDIFYKYIKDAIEKQSNMYVKAEASRIVKAEELKNQINKAISDKDTAGVNLYVQRILTEYPGTYEAVSIRERFFPLIIGKDMPDFEVKSLSDEKIIYSNKSLKGKFYLMDFWATWCGPCMGELPGLHEAYKEFKEKNFEILSISLDEKKETVEKFRKEKSEMPWLHGFLDKGWSDIIITRFGISSIPKIIFVSDEGKILAMDSNVRGENLKKTLEKYLHSDTVSK